MTNANRWKRIIAWLLSSLFLYLVLDDYYHGAVLMGNPPSFASKRQVIFWAGMALVLAGWLWLLLVAVTGRAPRRLLGWLHSVRARIPLWLGGLLAGALLLVPAYMFLYSPVGLYDLHYWSRLGALVLFALLAMLLVFRGQGAWHGLLCWSALLLLAGAAFAAAGWLNRVTAYPFSLSWSEGNRMWDYSMMFPGGRYQIVGEVTATPYISIGRQLLWALPYIFPNLNIVGARLWDALLWIAPAALLALAVVAGKPGGWRWKALAAVWAFLFLAQGPIYAPLLVSALLVALAARCKPLWLAALLVMVAGYYAFISRTTWAYAPGLWAGLLALLAMENPRLSLQRWRDFIRPVVLGLAGYFGGQILSPLLDWAAAGFAAGPGVSLLQDAVGMTSRQPLLWDRLLPNPTFPPGILLAALWAGLPLIVFLVALRLRGLWKPNRLQTLAFALIAAAFGAVGIVVSVKIGGGSNLHNMDMFWVTLLLVALAAWSEIVTRYENGGDGKTSPKIVDFGGGSRGSGFFLAALCLALIGPVTYNAAYGTPLDVATRTQAREALTSMRQIISAAAQRGEVLFIDQRQLLTFGEIDVPLVTEYEKKYLMDQAMADNARYFERFHADLEARRFVLIVTEPLRTAVLDPEDARNFSEENNAWVEWVAAPLLQYYEPVNFYEEVGIQLLAPKK